MHHRIMQINWFPVPLDTSGSSNEVWECLPFRYLSAAREKALPGRAAEDITEDQDHNTGLLFK